MNKLVLAVFISTLFTNKVWSDEIHPAMPAPADKVAPVAAPVKKHWWQFFKKPKPAPKPVTTSQIFSTKIVAWGGQFGNGSFGQMPTISGNNNYQPSSYGNNNPTCTYSGTGTAITTPTYGGGSTTFYSNGGTAITTPTYGGGSTTFYSGY